MVIKGIPPYSLWKPMIHFFQQLSFWVTLVIYIINLTLPFHWSFCIFLQLHFDFGHVIWIWFICYVPLSLDKFWHIFQAIAVDFSCITKSSSTAGRIKRRLGNTITCPEGMFHHITKSSSAVGHTRRRLAAQALVHKVLLDI